MAPCDPSDLNLDVPEPSGSPIAGFGIPFAPGLPDFDSLLPDGFPEDLLELMDLLQFILPGNIIKPALNPNFGKDVFDGIMKLLDQFFPFLMLYKFFLPILDLIICIIEVLCAISNPIKLIKKLKRLFRTCLPAFLSLFPIFAIIVMLLSLLFLILALIEYIIAKILEIIELLLRNILGLVKAFEISDEIGILAIIKKLSEILCAFQNLFVLFAIFKTIIDVIKEILKLLFKIPPCDDGDNGDDDKCCSPEVCPAFIKNNETVSGTSGTLQYFNQVSIDANLTSLLPSLPAGFLTNNKRNESWQFYDPGSGAQNAFFNITHAYDLPAGVDTVFFPTDASYNATTPKDQVPYTVDIRVFYEPFVFGCIDHLGSRFIRIKNCIVLQAPTQNLNNFDNSTSVVNTGVLSIQGGLAYEDDGKTPINIGDTQGTLNSIIHLNPNISIVDVPLLPTDGYLFQSLEYTFNINHEVLLSKSLITLGCIPTVGLDRTFINTVFGGNAGTNFALLNSLVNGDNFPDVGKAQECLATALSALRSNLGTAGVATFQATTTACLDKLKSDTNSAINTLLSIGFDPYKSTFSINPSVQFTTLPILVQVDLKETSGQSLTLKMPPTVETTVSKKLKATTTLGKVDQFKYDGAQFFDGQLRSNKAGTGTIKMSFDGKVFSNVVIPTDVTLPPSIEEIVIPYTFVYSPTVPTPDGDTDGTPRFDESDVSREK